MHPPVTTVNQNDHVAAAAYLMKRADATALIVTQGQSAQPVGIITEADISHAVADGKNPNDVRIYQVMTADPTVVSTTASIRDAAKVMTGRRFRHLPVMGDAGLVGIVDITDVCSALLDVSETAGMNEVMGREMAKAMTRPGDMLLGRRTWQDFTTAWGRRTDGNPVTTRMNATAKYVVSRTLEDADGWQNSVLLRGDAAGTVAELKAQPSGDLGIIGSVSLVRSLHAAGLIDRYTLLICPLTLGSGARLFESAAPLTEFELTSSVTTSKGVIIAQYTRR